MLHHNSNMEPTIVHMNNHRRASIRRPPTAEHLGRKRSAKKKYLERRKCRLQKYRSGA